MSNASLGENDAPNLGTPPGRRPRDPTAPPPFRGEPCAYWDVVSCSLDYGEESRVEKSLRARL